MRTINLDKKELDKVNQIIDEYRKIESDLTDIQNQLDSLNSVKEKTFALLESNRKEEEKFFKKLKQKHGEGQFDIYSMKYVIKDGKN